ncbi:aldo/keto reductase [Corynebacterium lubricantis]|uniref:aldo/keto reductase n=1 Tax=Corynebacterium lubricantis TaxID=541095 RepID=UPI000525991B|nr:aldo/keto reductase [Corynebacterium lubricantis]
MKKRNVGHSGLKISPIGLSAASWTADTATELLSAFVDAGGNLITVTSEMLPLIAPAIAQVGREKLVISLTAGVDMSLPVGQRVDCSRTALRRSLVRALSESGLEYVDIFSAAYWDPRTPSHEVSSTLAEIVQSGHAMYAGAAGYAGWQLAVTPGLTAAHNEYSLLRREVEEELLPAADHLGVGTIAAAPLARGLLSSGYTVNSPAVHPYRGDKSRTIVEAVATAAEGLSMSPAATALAWVLGREGISGAIVGAQSAEELTQLLPAAQTPLPRPIMAALDDVSK